VGQPTDVELAERGAWNEDDLEALLRKLGLD
jgi:hypothetical protein